MAASFPQRSVDADRTLPPVEPVLFTKPFYAVQPGDAAGDMGPLADRIRQIARLMAGDPLHLPLGGAFFDVVVATNGPEASAAIDLLDELQRAETDGPEACGPVIEDPDLALLYWLVPSGTSAQWPPCGYAICFGQPHTITLPPLAQTEPPGIYWRRPCRADRLIPGAPLRDLLDRYQPAPVPYDAPLGPVLATNP